MGGGCRVSVVSWGGVIVGVGGGGGGVSVIER